MRILKPPGLRNGDIIGIVSPSGPLADDRKLEGGVRYLESIGYRVKIGRHVGKRDGYLAGTDVQRLADIHAMFRDRRVKALFCLRGGYGTSRLLPGVDYPLIARNPKILLGFSDITALQLALWQKCRLITFHGPMVAADLTGNVDPYTEEHLWRVLTSCERSITISFRSRRFRAVRSGNATGRLLGGNLSLLANLVGTDYLPRFNNALFFLEEIGEEPYKIDRMCAQLLNAGVLRGVRGLLSGTFVDCEPKDPLTSSRDHTIVLEELAGALKVPFVRELPFGHIRQKVTLPVGCRAMFRTSTRSLELLESAVC